MSDPEATFFDTGYGITEAEASQMFGKKCFKAGKGGKPFIILPRLHGVQI